MEKGYFVRSKRAKAGALATIDNVTKFALSADDYEEFEEWVEYTPEELRQRAAAAAKAELEATREEFEGLIETLFSVDSAAELLGVIMNNQARELMAKRKKLRAKINEAAGIAAE